MATLSTITTRVANLLGSSRHLSTAEIESVAATRYEQEAETWRWSRRLRDFTISTVAQVSNATGEEVTATNGSATVTSAGTPFTSGMVGRQIAIGTDSLSYYFVGVFNSSASIDLADGEGNAVTWPGDTESDLSWRIFQTLYTLPADADDLVSLAGQRDLEEVDGGRAALDWRDPQRISTNTWPTEWCWAGETTAGLREIEVWPVPSSAVLLRGQYVRQAPALTSVDRVDIPTPLLVYATAADCANLLFAKTGDPAWESRANFFEGRTTSIREDYRFKDGDRLSRPRTLGRAARSNLAHTDWAVSHHDEVP